MPTEMYMLKGGGGLSFPSGIQLDASYLFYSAPSIELPAAEGDLWDPGHDNAWWFEVYFFLVNNDAAGADASGIYVGREINSAGGLTRPHYWMFNDILPFPGRSGWQGPHYMHGDDAVRGYAAAANTVSIHFKVRRLL